MLSHKGGEKNGERICDPKMIITRTITVGEPTFFPCPTHEFQHRLMPGIPPHKKNSIKTKVHNKKNSLKDKPKPVPFIKWI